MLSTVLHPSCDQARGFPSIQKARIPDTVQPREEKREETRNARCVVQVGMWRVGHWQHATGLALTGVGSAQ